MSEQNSVINAVKRLERAGSTNSRATEKVIAAACEVAELVIKAVPVGAELPRGYRVQKLRSNVGGETRYLMTADGDGDSGPVAINGDSGFLNGDFNSPRPGDCPRWAALDFATDVAAGWLDEVAAWLEERAAKADAATSVLDAAAARLQAEQGQ